MSAPFETFVTYGAVCTHGQLERVCPLCELTAERDALAELVREVHDGHYDIRSEFVASPDWLARARAAIGEGK